MEKALVLQAQSREQTGTHSTAKLRRQGRIPAIVYGHKKEPAAVSLDAHDFTDALQHGRRVIDVKCGSSKETVMVKDLQYDYLGKHVIHADLMRVDVSEIVTVSVPVQFKGEPKGAADGGVVVVHVDSLEVRCKVSDIPEVFVVSVKEMQVGDSIHAGDIAIPEGVTLVDEPETLIAACSLVTAAKTPEEIEKEIPAAPEVIGEAEREKKKGEEGQQEESK